MSDENLKIKFGPRSERDDLDRLTVLQDVETVDLTARAYLAEEALAQDQDNSLAVKASLQNFQVMQRELDQSLPGEPAASRALSAGELELASSSLSVRQNISSASSLSSEARLSESGILTAFPSNSDLQYDFSFLTNSTDSNEGTDVVSPERQSQSESISTDGGLTATAGVEELDSPSDPVIPPEEPEQEPEQEEEEVTPPVDPDPEVEVAPVSVHTNLNVRVSNATRQERFIDSSDGYDLTPQSFAVSQTRSGADLDITGVSSSANLTYTFKDANSLDAVLNSSWNSLKNIEVKSDQAVSVSIKNFVHVDMLLGTGSQDASIISIQDAKRGTIQTGAGADEIDIKGLTNDAGWSNSFTVNSGKGDDTIHASGSKGHTRFTLDAGDGNDKLILSGHYADAQINLGSGDDHFIGGAGKDTITGGLGRDMIDSGAGNDILAGGDGRDTFIVKAESGHVSIKDFGGVGRGNKGEASLLPKHDTIRFESKGMTDENMLLNYNGKHTVITFEGINNFSLTLENFDFTRLDNLPDVPAYNILFYGQGTGVDSFDVFNDHTARQKSLWTSNTTTHLNNADNIVAGKNNSADIINGMKGNDTLAGLGGHDILRGQEGNDILNGGKDQDSLDGGAGEDTALFSGNRAEYHITQNSDGTYSVIDKIAKRDGTDTLKDIETIRFKDGEIMQDNFISPPPADPDQGEALTRLENGNYDISGLDGFTLDIDSIAASSQHNSSFGHYFARADGTPISGVIDFANVKSSLGAGDAVTISYSAEMIPDGATQLGFFLIPDGDRKNKNLDDGTDVTFKLQKGQWIPYAEGQALKGQSVNAFFSDEKLNKDHLDHVKSYDDRDMAWEDQYRGGDKDYDDAILNISVTEKKQAPISESASSSSEADDGNNGHGNDKDRVDGSNPGKSADTKVFDLMFSLDDNQVIKESWDKTIQNDSKNQTMPIETTSWVSLTDQSEKTNKSQAPNKSEKIKSQTLEDILSDHSGFTDQDIDVHKLDVNEVHSHTI